MRFTDRGLAKRIRFHTVPALSLVPDARAPPNGCAPTTEPVTPAKSAAEIGLAIAAEIVAVREGRSDATDRRIPNVTAAAGRADQREIAVS